MKDTKGKTASTLAITEKKPHRPGGFVGIFLQLFDWNRRSAEKKLFSKKLLPPARAKQASRKFGLDDKLHKLHLIADENSAGFPNVKNNVACHVDSEQTLVRAPSLVARLMGLESMPALKQDKSKNASNSLISIDRREKSEYYQRQFNGEHVNFKKGCVKHDLRLQKLQKVGSSERRPVTRFGAEALRFKNVLPRSKKHHPILVSPVKSPRIYSGKNASRLNDVATKILEPGLQATNRAKHALTYLNSVHHAPGDDTMIKRTPPLSRNLFKDSKSLKGQCSCKNCGSLLEVVDSRSNLEDHLSYSSSLLSNDKNPSHVLERSKPRPTMSSFEQGERVFHRSRELSPQLGTQTMDYTQTLAEPIAKGKPLNQEGRKDTLSSAGFKQKTRSQNRMSVGRDRVPPRSRVIETKDFVSLNRSLSGRTKTRTPNKLNDCKFDSERKPCDRRDDSLSPMLKRSSASVGRDGECSGLFTTTSGKQRNIKCDAMSEKGRGLHAHSPKSTCIERRLNHVRETNRTGGNKDTDGISVTLNSPMKHKNGIPPKMEQKGRNQIDNNSNTIQQKISTADNTDGKSCFKKPSSLSGDALGALLEHKLKELTCQEEDEAATGCNLPKRTNAAILQELISALTVENSISQDDVFVESCRNDVSCYSSHMPSTKLTLQAKTKTAGALIGCSRDGDHLSPGSVLEASFSNDSCFSSSMDGNSGHQHLDSMDCTYEESLQLEAETGILDSATSLSKDRTGKQFLIDHLNHVSEVLCTLNLPDAGLKGSKFSHAKEVILNAEMLFGNVTLHKSNRISDFSITSFLIDDLETLVIITQTNFGPFLGFGDTKQENQIRGFVFDCLIEHLNSRYSRYCTYGLKALPKVALRMDGEVLIREVGEEVSRWTDLAGLSIDELIEREMSHSLGKWTEFEIEAFENGAEIDEDIFQILVEEMVIDLWGCGLGSCGISNGSC